MPVATKRLGVYHSTGTRTSVLLYICPAGFRTIVKSLLVAARVATTTHATVWLGAGGGSVNPFIFNGDLQDGGHVEVMTWYVLEAGDSVYADATAAGIEIWLSGTELALP